MVAVGAAIEPLARLLLGPQLSVRIRCWDGSEIGPADARNTLLLRSPDALRRLLYAPNELGITRAYVAGDLDFEGSVSTSSACATASVSPASTSTSGSTAGPSPSCGASPAAWA